MDRKRLLVTAGIVVGTLSLATAAGAANLGLLRSGSDDPAPAIGNLDAGNGGTLARATSTSDDSPSSTDAQHLGDRLDGRRRDLDRRPRRRPRRS